MFKRKTLFIFLTTIGLIAIGFFVIKSQTSKPEVWHVQMAGQDLWIPKEYFVRPIYQAKTECVFLHSLYPNLTTLQKSETEYSKEKNLF